MSAPFGKLDPAPGRILVRGVNWLGDAVMTTPAIQRLREAYPEANITLLTHEKLADIWRSHPHIDRVETFSGADNALGVGADCGRGISISASRCPTPRGPPSNFGARIFPTVSAIARPGAAGC